MKNIIKTTDLQIINYAEAFEYQEKLFFQNIEIKTKSEKTKNYLLFCEHPHVYTMGKSGNENNLLINEEFLKRINAQFIKTNRGGDITYHGYGQLVIYPIFDLANFSILIKKYIFNIEEVIIRTLKEYNIKGERFEHASGVWLKNKKIPEKICALGVRVSKGITMHGLALNLNTDLNYFKYINPCGFEDKGITSMENELGHKIEMNEVKKYVEKYFNEIFT